MNNNYNQYPDQQYQEQTQLQPQQQYGGQPQYGGQQYGGQSQYGGQQYGGQPHSSQNQQYGFGNRMVTVNLKRKWSYVGMAMPMKILLNGLEIGKLKVGGTMSFQIPFDSMSEIKVDMVGNGLNKDMNLSTLEGVTYLHPSRQNIQGVLNLRFGIKFKWSGIFSYGLADSVGDIYFEIN